MGAAAYNRGSRALRDRIDREQSSAAMRYLRTLTEHSIRHAGAVLLGPTVIRFGPGAGEASVMNRADRGWGEYAYTYPSIWKAAAAFRVAFVGMGRDEASAYFEVVPVPREET